MIRNARDGTAPVEVRTVRRDSRRRSASWQPQGAPECRRHLGRYAPNMFIVSNQRFEELAAEALASLPENLSAQIDNVAILIEDNAQGRSLFGLYEGVPLTNRGLRSYSGVLPDRITLYQTAICSVCHSENDVRVQVRKTVIHEIAHHFGISDPRLEELGWA